MKEKEGKRRRIFHPDFTYFIHHQNKRKRREEEDF